MKRFVLISSLLILPLLAEEPINIEGRRELFVDEMLIGKMEGTELKMHEPTLLKPKTPARPTGHYATVFKDGDLFRMYYRGDKIPGTHWRNGWGKYHENEVTLYAESKNGYDWIEPDLGIYKIESMSKGNVVLDVDEETFLKTHNFSPFIDKRPGVPKEERYKALGGGRYPAENWGSWKTEDERAKLIEKYGSGGLCAFSSSDGLNWKLMQKSPVLSESIGNYDSQNVSFWSEAEGCYVCYYRWFRDGLRSMRRVTSKDFITWSKPVEMKANLPGEHLYTSGTQPYFRAPHLYIALATRFQTKRSAITDVVFMSTRPGSDHYDRTFREAFIRPGLGAQGWGNRSNYIAWGVVPTNPREMSMYMYGGGHYVLRTDGFISVHAGYESGEFITKPLIFSGENLDINYSTSAAGRMRVEILNAETGEAFPGFSEMDSRDIYGDDISRIVKWGEGEKGNTDVSSLAGKAVQLRFIMNETDLYSIQFVGSK